MKAKLCISITGQISHILFLRDFRKYCYTQDHQASNFQGLSRLIRICPEPYRTSNQISVSGFHYTNRIFQGCRIVWMAGFCKITLNLNVVLTANTLPCQNPPTRLFNYSFPNDSRYICNNPHMLLYVTTKSSELGMS